MGDICDASSYAPGCKRLRYLRAESNEWYLVPRQNAKAIY